MNRLFKTSVLMAAISTSLVLAADWPSFAGNAANSGSSQDVAPRDLSNAVVTTSANLGLKESTSPVIADGKAYVYANGATGTLYCLDSEALTTLWSAPVMVDDATGWGSWASPAAGSSSIVFAADSFLGCWNLDGSERWAVTLSNQTINSSCKVSDGKIFVSCFHYLNSEFSVAAFDILTGSNLWNLTDPAFAFSPCTPVIDSGAGKGYVAAGNKVAQFDLASGSAGWSTNLPDALMLQNLSMSGNSLFVSDFAFASYVAGSNLYSVSKSNGAVNWVAQVNVSSVPPAIEGNVLVHSAGDAWGVPQELTGIDINTGTQIWKVAKSLGGGTLMPAISKGVVYASANNATNLTCVNVADGSVASEIVVGGSSPAVANDTLYTVFNGALYAYSHKAGALSVDKATAKILLAKIAKDNAKLSVSIPMDASPTNWLNNSMTIKLGEIYFLHDETGKLKKGNDKKALWKFVSADKTSKTTIKWTAKKKVLQIKAGVKKLDLRNTIPYKTTDGTETSDITTIFRAGDYAFFAKSTDSMTTETKKDKVKLKYKK